MNDAMTDMLNAEVIEETDTATLIAELLFRIEKSNCLEDHKVLWKVLKEKIVIR